MCYKHCMQISKLPQNRQIRMLMADDHSLILQGLRALLKSAPDIEVVAECESSMDAYNA